MESIDPALLALPVSGEQSSQFSAARSTHTTTTHVHTPPAAGTGRTSGLDRTGRTDHSGPLDPVSGLPIVADRSISHSAARSRDTNTGDVPRGFHHHITNLSLSPPSAQSVAYSAATLPRNLLQARIVPHGGNISFMFNALPEATEYARAYDAVTYTSKMMVDRVIARHARHDVEVLLDEDMVIKAYAFAKSADSRKEIDFLYRYDNGSDHHCPRKGCQFGHDTHKKKDCTTGLPLGKLDKHFYNVHGGHLYKCVAKNCPKDHDYAINYKLRDHVKDNGGLAPEFLQGG